MKETIHCPNCSNKVSDELEVGEGEIKRQRCQKCDTFFWVLGELTIRTLIDPKETKKPQKV